MSFGGLTLLAPLTLLGLIALPIIWWVMRISPPQPRRQAFPPLRILRDIQSEEQTPDKTPLWLLLFRLFMGALIVFALSNPIRNASEPSQAKPLTVILDQSVMSAPIWNDIISEAEDRVREARSNNLNVRLISSAQTYETLPELRPAQNALDALKRLQPAAYHIGAQSYASLISSDIAAQSDIIWLTSGIDNKNDTSHETALKGSGALIIRPDVTRLILPGDVRETAQGFESDWHRPAVNDAQSVIIEALSAYGSVVAAQTLNFGPSQDFGTVSFSLPAQLRARIARIRAAGIRSAASIKLLDDSFGRPIVGVLTPTADSSSPLLTEPFYAKQALLPYADIFEGDEDTLLSLEPSIIVMPDSQNSDSPAMLKFVEDGGMVVRFAGPRLAKREDTLLPVRLRSGGRAIGGALAWEEPQRLAPFPQESPFFGLPIPNEVTVSKQVMAEPGIETDRKTWARLEDGSPIVTTDIFGEGRVVLYHVTAGPEWSNLAINGLYVDMLRRLLPLAKGRITVQNQTGSDWILDRTLDGFGNFTAPPAKEQIIKGTDFEDTQTGNDTLPGYYRQGTRLRSLQPVSNPADMLQIDLPSGTKAARFGSETQASFMGILLAIGAILLAVDAIIALIMSGRWRYLFSRSAGRAVSSLAAVSAITALSLSMLVYASAASAQTPAPPSPPNVIVPETLVPETPNQQNETQDSPRVLEAVTGLHLAYIETGDTRRDRLSRTALESLARQLTARTTIEPAGVHSVAPDDSGLYLYPFLYWSVRRDTPALTPQAAANINNYMASGGTVIFDTADEGDRALRSGAPHPGLARVTQDLDIPALTTIPEDHVLTKSYYLTQVFPGRWANGPVYVQAGDNSSSGRDGVSPVIIGSQDWAAGWAIDPDAGSVIELSKDIPKQREMSVRFGINIAMYALAGNYKADQVHAAELIERIGSSKSAPLSLEPEK